MFVLQSACFVYKLCNFVGTVELFLKFSNITHTGHQVHWNDQDSLANNLVLHALTCVCKLDRILPVPLLQVASHCWSLFAHGDILQSLHLYFLLQTLSSLSF